MKHYSVTLVGTAAQNVRTTLIAAGDTDTDLVDDHGFRHLAFTADPANSTAIRIGDADLTDDTWGLFIPVPDTNVPAAPQDLGHYDAGPLKLSDLWVKGADGEILHIIGVPF